jgi:cytidylate kinase
MVVIAIDGPSGSGKSSVSRALAQEFGWAYLDTGALYRTLTLLALQSKADFLACISEGNSQGSELSNWIGDPRDPQVLLKGERVNTLIRSQEITDRVSEIAANPQVRSYLLEIQRTLINQATRGIVVEGRDIGTTVWPDAELKIFREASHRFDR